MISEYYASKKNIVSNSNLYFGECLELYYENLFKRNKRKNMDVATIYDHMRKVNSDILSYFEKYKISEIDTQKIEEFLDYLRERPNKRDPSKNISETTVSNFLKTLNTILNFLVNKKIIKENPAKFICNAPQPKKTKKELSYFKPNEAIYALKCVNKFADIRFKSFMNFIFALGCRCEEACGLRWKDINFETKEISFNYAVTNSIPKKFVGEKRVRVKDLKTHNSYRVNILPLELEKVLKQYYSFKINCGFKINEDDFIFTQWESNELADPHKFSESWRFFKIRYGIKNVDLHRIRHTVANILERKSVPKKDIAKLLGNTERVLQEYYTHVDYKELGNIKDIIKNELFDTISSVELEIELVVKIINEYDFGCFTDQELKTLDLVCDEQIDNNNYYTLMKQLKNNILDEYKDYSYFIDEDLDKLETKISTFKKFNNGIIKLKKINDFSIRKDISSF